jgi:hypothetical protein
MIFSPWCQTQLFETKNNGGKQGASHRRKYITPANEIATMIFGGFFALVCRVILAAVPLPKAPLAFCLFLFGKCATLALAESHRFITSSHIVWNKLYDYPG